jgi:hypothetical protein
MVIMPVMWHVPRLSFTFLHLLFLKKKKKKIKIKIQNPSPLYPFSSQTHFLPPTVTWFSPTGTGVTPLLFLFSFYIEMEGQEDPDPTNPRRPTFVQLVQSDGKRGWSGGFGCQQQHRNPFSALLDSRSSVLHYCSWAPPLSSSPNVSSIILSPVQPFN